MKKKPMKYGLSFIVSVMLIFSLLQITAYAAETTAQNGDIGLYSNIGSFTVNGTSVSYTSTLSGFVWSQSYDLRIYNYSGSKATISFDYTEGFGDTFSFNGGATSGSYSETLDAGAYISITATSKCTSGQTDTLSITNLKLVVVSESVLTFSYDDGLGSITAAGSTVTNNGTYTNTDTENGVALVATPNSGVQFIGWMNADTNEIISRDASYTYLPTANVNVQAVFTMETADAWFMAGGTHMYSDLNNAATKASSSSAKTVVLLSDGVLPSGTYTIPSGVTLLVPFDLSNTLYTTEPDYLGETMTTPTAFRTLTMAEGAKLVINGAMSISGQFAFTNAGGQSGSPSGPLGFVDMESGSNITVNGTLYAWGYVIGDGTVTVNSGATVYEYCQMPEYRGGDQSTGMSNKVFPLSQYYIQNVEVKMTLAAGANLKTYGKVYASKLYFETGIQLFGSGGMFELSSGSATKWYDGTTDRMYIEINGAATMNSISLTLSGSILGGGQSINSASYVLPIHGGFTITLKSGSSLSMPSTQDVLLQPGAQIIIEENANCTVNGKLYIYDAAQWGAYCWYGHSNATTANSYDTPVMPVTYSPTRTYIRPTIFPDAATYPLPTTQAEYLANFTNNITSGDGSLNEEKLAAFLASLPDAAILVNGSLTGNIYTTAGGANIYSTGSGTFTQSATENSSVYQLKQRDVTYDEASSTPAQLKNADGSYVSSTANTYNYCSECGVWDLTGHVCKTEEAHTHNYTKTESWDEKTLTYTVTLTCGDCDAATEGHTLTASALAAVKSSTAGTCQTAATTTYTATVTLNDTTYTMADQTVTGDKDTTNHTNVVTDAAVAATCTTDGLTEGSHCGDCNTVIVAQTTVEASGHSYGDWVVTTAPGCETEGEETKTCTVCGDKQTQAVKATGHNMQVTSTQDPTCTDAGSVTSTCANGCGHTETTTGEAATGCDFSDEWSSDDTTHWHACSICGAASDTSTHADDNNDHKCDTCSYTMSSCVDADKNHDCDLTGCSVTMGTCEDTDKDHYCDYGAGTEGGCTDYFGEHKDADGDKDHVCDYCESSEVLSDCTAGTAVTEDEVAAKCETTGSYDTVTYCTECGEEMSRVTTTVDALTHSYGTVTYNWSTDGKSCTATHSCTRTGCTHSETATATVEGKVTTDATCTVMGTTTYTATFSVDWTITQTTTRQDVAVIDHSYDQQKIEDTYKKSDATCTAKAVYYYSCSCGAMGTETFESGEANGHQNTEIIDAKDVTCGEAGYTGDTYCNDCETIIGSGETIAASGNHSYGDWEIVKEATCTEAGSQKKTCSVCDNVVTEDIPATGEHIDSETDNDHICDTCDTVLSTCSYGDWVNNGDGTQSKTCSVCGNEVTETIPVELDPIVDMTGTVTPATVTAPENGWQLGENTFSVMCDLACMVAYTEDGGETYYRLDATPVKDESGEVLYYTFDVILTEDTQIVIYIKGDIDGDGTIEGTEVIQIKATQLDKLKTFTALQIMISDIDGDGAIEGTEVIQIKAAQLGKLTLAW